MHNMPRNRVESYLEAREPSVDRRLVPRPNKKNLEMLLEDDESDDTIEYSLENKTTAAQLYLRLRPINDDNICDNYVVSGNVFITKADTPQNSKSMAEKHFTFSRIFNGSAADQAHVYETCVKDSIDSEENLTILTYGTSGSGKTFTLLGDLDSPGIIPRALEQLFILYSKNIYPKPAVKIVNGDIALANNDEIDIEESLRNNLLSTDPEIRQHHEKLKKIIDVEHKFQTLGRSDKMVFIWISFAEIYNEIIYDLLAPNMEQDHLKRRRLKISSNIDKVFIKGLTSVNVRNSREAYTLLSKGIKQITYGSTCINDHSSRSHCVFFINVIMFSGPDTFTNTLYQFCDLAGSERQKKAGNIGNRLREATSINTSLTVLSRCLHAVHQNQQKKCNEAPPPFRESKLTMLLRDALLGKEKITIIINLAPVKKYFDENLNVLGFANIAKSIFYKQPAQKATRSTRYSWFVNHAASSSSSVLPNTEVDILHEENITLRSEIERLNSEIERLEKLLLRQETDLRKSLVEEYEKHFNTQNELWEKRLKQKEISLKLWYEAKIDALQERNKRRRDTELGEFENKKISLDNSTDDLNNSKENQPPSF